MRILSIKLKNINSLRGEHEISFDQSPFKEAGLFGIVGATGSGKSTLLDSITLALYNRVPRYGLVSRKLLEKGGVILTRHEKDCYVEVKYESRKGVFTARWSVGKTRNNTFRDVEMKVLNEAGDMLNEGLSTAPEVNMENIGLDYDQFVKSILLCQGEFARFLQSDKNKRAELLEKITGTKAFRKIGVKAYKAYHRRKGEIDIIVETIKTLSDSRLSQETRAELAEAITTGSAASSTIAGELDKAKHKLQLKKRLAQLSADLELKRSALEKAGKALDVFHDEHAKKLEHYDKLFPYREDLASHQRMVSRKAALENKLTDADKRISELGQAIAHAVEQLRQWVNDDVSDTNYLEKLESLRDRVMEAEARRKQFRAELKAGHERIGAMIGKAMFSEEKPLFKPKGNNDQLLKMVDARITTARGEYEEKIRGLEEAGLGQAKALLMQMTEDIALLQADVRSFMQLKHKVKASTSHIDQLEKAITARALESEGQRRELGELEKALSDAEKEKDQLLSAQNLDELRKRLVDGEPCPLCGAEHHPYVHAFALDVLGVTDKHRQLKEQVRVKREMVNKLEVDQRSDESAKQLEATFVVQNEEQLKKHTLAIETLKSKLNIDKIQSEDKIAELLQQNREKLARVEWCMQFLNEEPQVLQLKHELETYDGHCERLEAVEAELKRLYPGEDFQTSYQQKKDAMTANLDHRKSLQAVRQQDAKDLETETKNLTALDTRLVGELQKAGYRSIDEARSYLIDEAQQKALRHQQEQLVRAVAVGSTSFNELQDMLINERQDDDDTVNVEQQQEIVNGLNGRIAELGAVLEEKRTRLASDDRLLDDIRKKEEEKKRHLDELRPWEMLNKLIGDSTGNKFNTRAQELTLQHLLLLANRRMDKLHSRYTLLLPEKLEDDDLRVSDAFMGDEVRTVRSLSGGETFVLSLALALGLSDLASRDIRIDSLFVDEGFGSLDPDTLEEAMSTLEQLQNESNKMVGIISHVESLKERIYTQIRLEKGNNGFSSVTIFPDLNAQHGS